MSDLVLELRRVQAWLKGWDTDEGYLLGNAADRIEALEAEVMRLQRQRERFDCQYAGQYAEMSGRHCPIGDPCQRCRMEQAEAEVERQKLAHEDIYREYGEKCERVEQLREALSECLEYLEPSFFEEEALVLGVVKRARASLAGEGDRA